MDVKEGQWVWVCNWTWRQAEALRRRGSKDFSVTPRTKKRTGPGSPLFSNCLVDESLEMPRIAARVVNVTRDGAVVWPMWGDVCTKCGQQAEHGPHTRPANIHIKFGAQERGGAYLIPMDESNIEGRDDMVDLADLKVGELMHNIRLRYKSKPIQHYTNVGEILVVVNPMEDTGVINEAHMRSYHQARETMPPHIYATGKEAYNKMMETKQNQSVIISGDSGAGKSESTKHVLAYLAYCSEQVGAASAVTARILATSDVLEAFGNAKTKRNHNSSRFGKYVSIQFNERGGIVGAQTEQYLLEKSRVVAQEENERNFHIFYMLLEALPRDQLDALGLTRVADYRYLVGKGGVNVKSWQVRPDGETRMDDRERFRTLVTNLEKLDIGVEDQAQLWRIMAAVLHLGQVVFQDDRSASSDGVIVRNPDCVERIAQLLEVDSAALMTTLTRKRIMNAHKNFTSQHAYANADALAKAIYGRLFESLVDDRINAGTRARSHATYIGVLDIFGFESFQERKLDKSGKDFYIDTMNKFEQLCINLTNEQLQHFFYQTLIPKQQKKYEAEGIIAKNIYFADNTPCLNLIAKEGRSSLFGILDEVTRLSTNDHKMMENPGLADKRWLSDIKEKYRSSSDNIHSAGTRKAVDHEFLGFMARDLKHSLDLTNFCIYHYAGQVWYTVDGAVEHNKDQVSSDLTEVMAASRATWIASLFSGQQDAQRKTISKKFSEQLVALQAQLAATTPLFVRCVKPNCTMRPGGVFEDHRVLDQLICAGMYAIVEMRHNGYPVERTPENLVNVFSILEDDQGKLRSMGAVEQARYLCESVVRAHPEETRDRDGMPPFQIGNTKVFLKDKLFKFMHRLRARALATLRERQQTAFSHLKALFLMWKEVSVLPARKKEAAAMRVLLARRRAFVARGMTIEEADRAVAREDHEEDERLREEYKRLHVLPLQDAIVATLTPLRSAVQSLEGFLSLTDLAPSLHAEMENRKKALISQSARLQDEFAQFASDRSREAMKSQVQATLDAFRAALSAERKQIVVDVKRRADEIEKAALERARLAEEARVRKVAEEKRKAAEAQRRREEAERRKAEEEVFVKQRVAEAVTAERTRRVEEKQQRKERAKQKIREQASQADAITKEAEAEQKRAQERSKAEEREKRRAAAKATQRKQQEAIVKHSRTRAMVGMLVRYEDMICEVKYVGHLPYEGSGEFIGIQCPKPLGNMNDGTVLGVRLFQCPANTGKFVRAKMVDAILPKAAADFSVGDRVWCKNTPHTGTIKWVGTPGFATGAWIGVELDEQGVGKNDGSVEGRRYFTCAAETGVFVRPQAVHYIHPLSEQFMQERVDTYLEAHGISAHVSEDEEEEEAALAAYAKKQEAKARQEVAKRSRRAAEERFAAEEEAQCLVKSTSVPVMPSSVVSYD